MRLRSGQVLMEIRHGLCVDLHIASFPHDVLGLGIEPHIAVNEHAARSSPARKFVWRRGYSIGQRIRKRISR
jgi:hypothetical protein